MSEYATKRFSLDKNTTITVGLVLALLTPLAGFSMWISAKFNDLDRRLEKIEDASMRAGEDRWTGGDMKVWAAQLKALNPTMNIPEVD